MQLEQIVDEHNVLLERTPSFPDVQSAWALLLHCANALANHALRVVRTDSVRHFAQAHGARLWRLMCAIVRVSEDKCDSFWKDAASLPLNMGVWGCAASCGRATAHSGRVGQTHANGRDALDSDPTTPTLFAFVEAAHVVHVANHEPPSWVFFYGTRPPSREPDEVVLSQRVAARK